MKHTLNTSPVTAADFPSPHWFPLISACKNITTKLQCTWIAVGFGSTQEMIWSGQFLKLLNSHDDSIKISAEVSDSMVDSWIMWMLQFLKAIGEKIITFWTLIVHFKTQILMNYWTVILSTQNILSGIIKSQLICILKMYNNMEDFENPVLNCRKLFEKGIITLVAISAKSNPTSWRNYCPTGGTVTARAF